MQETPDTNNPMSIKSMFDDIAKDYDKLNNLMTFYLHHVIKYLAVHSIQTKPKVILDICTGTGDIARLLAQKYPNAHIVAVDFSNNMLDIARKKTHDKLNIEFYNADATHLPFENDSFDLCTISFGLRNLLSIELALKEIYRILKYNGQLMIIDLGKPRYEWLYPVVLNKAIPFFGTIVHGDTMPYEYLVRSANNYPSPDKILEKLSAAGYINTKNIDFLMGTIAAQYGEKSK